MRSTAVVVIVLFALSGCLVTTTESEKPLAAVEQQSQPGAPSAQANQPPRRDARAPQCSPAGESCAQDTECCSGTFCFDFSYAPPVCVVARPDGAFCMKDTQCQSGACHGGRCGGACTNLGTACDGDADCCPGSFCYDYTYEPVVCRAALPDGSHCLEDRHCASANCANYACAP